MSFSCLFPLLRFLSFEELKTVEMAKKPLFFDLKNIKSNIWLLMFMQKPVNFLLIYSTYQTQPYRSRLLSKHKADSRQTQSEHRKQTSISEADPENECGVTDRTFVRSNYNCPTCTNHDYQSNSVNTLTNIRVLTNQISDWHLICNCLRWIIVQCVKSRPRVHFTLSG